MQTGVFSKRSYEKAKGSLHFIFTSFDTHFSKLLSSYILSGFRIFFYFLHPFKESNVSSFVDTVNFNIFQKVIASRVHLYIFSGCENCLLKKPCILPVCHSKSFFFLSRKKRARQTKMYQVHFNLRFLSSYCAFHKHAYSEVQKPTDDCVFHCRQSS